MFRVRALSSENCLRWLQGFLLAARTPGLMEVLQVRHAMLESWVLFPILFYRIDLWILIRLEVN